MSQQDILNVLKRKKTMMSVRDVQGEFPHLSRTTLTTGLTKLRRSGLVNFKPIAGNSFVYWAKEEMDDKKKVKKVLS